MKSLTDAAKLLLVILLAGVIIVASIYIAHALVFLLAVFAIGGIVYFFVYFKEDLKL